MKLEEFHYKYYESFMEFWIPIYKRQVFKAKFKNEIDVIISIKNNVMKNIHLNNEAKVYILKQLGI